MRSSADFIEVTVNSGRKYLVNKSAIILVEAYDNNERAIIMTINGDQPYKIMAKESYKDVAEELLWSGWKQNIDTNWWMSPPGEKAPEEENEI